MIALWIVLLAVPGRIQHAEKLIGGETACQGCHPAITAQWRSSAHRLSSFNNPFYAAATQAFRAERGHAASVFCGDCHDPALVDQMSGPIDIKSPAAQAGIGCMTCHGMTDADIRGNGQFTAEVTAPHPGPTHAEYVARPLLRTPKMCGSCHRVGLLETVTHERWYRGQDEWGDWYDSAYAGRGLTALFAPKNQATCQTCHMPEVAVGKREKAARNGRVRDHRFLAANTALAHLTGDADWFAATQRTLQSAVSLRLADGGPGMVDVVLHNHGVGHQFPGGTSDSNDAWIEWTAHAADGTVLKTSIDHQLRAWPLDKAGQLLARRDVQHQRAVAFDTRLAPGVPRVVRYALPADAVSVRARLRYRKFTPDYAAFACADVPDPSRCLALPVTDVATAEVRLVDGRVPAQTDWQLRAEHAAGLAQGLSNHVVQARDLLDGGPALPVIRARIAQALGQTTRVAEIVDGLGEAAPSNALWIQATALARAYRTQPALAVAERLVKRHPDDRKVLSLVARLRGVAKNPEGALQAAQRLLSIDPECEQGLFQRLLAKRELGHDVRAAEIEWARHRRATETDLELRRRWRAQWAGRGDPTEPVPTY